MFDIGRAKTRAFEFNSGNAASTDSGTTTMLSNSVTTGVKFKHFLFDVEMFSHLNVNGIMSGALTTVDKLTGGTSGATGIVESITTEGSATITGATQADPVVITMSSGHNFTDGQQVEISSVGGMTELNTNDGNSSSIFTVHNATDTTFELFTKQTAATTVVEPLDGTSFSAFTSGGDVKHTTIVLNDVQGEFVGGETITAPTNSRTGTVQFDSIGCKGFETKDFGQVKGISMAGSPTYTANTSLDTTFGDNKTLSGLITTVNPDLSPGSIILDGTDANSTDAGDSIILEDGTETGDLVNAIGLENPIDQADVLVGSGTKFTTELKIGDQINFIDDTGSSVTRIVQNIESNTRLQTVRD